MGLMSFMKGLFASDKSAQLPASASVAVESRPPQVGLGKSPYSRAEEEKARVILEKATLALNQVWGDAEAQLKAIRKEWSLRATSHKDKKGCCTGHLALAVNTTTQDKCC